MLINNYFEIKDSNIRNEQARNTALAFIEVRLTDLKSSGSCRQSLCLVLELCKATIRRVHNANTVNRERLRIIMCNYVLSKVNDKN